MKDKARALKIEIRSFIDGQFIEAVSGKFIEKKSPAIIPVVS